MVDKPKDDNAFEDADFEDLDSLEDDDLGDDGWDDDLGAVDSADSTGDTDDDSSERPVSGEKTFVQKNFMLIVVAIVVVFGGVIGLSLMGGGSSAPAPDEQAAVPGDALPDAPAQTAYEEGADMPPMPAPINPEEADGALTPMPTPAELQDNTELAELNVDEVPAQPPSGTTPQGEAPFDYRPTEEREASANPEPQNAAEKLSAEFKNRSQTESIAPVAPTETIIDSEGNVIAMPAPVIPEEKKAEEQQQQPSSAAEPAPTLQAPSEASPHLEAQDKQIESLQSKLGTQEAQIAEAEKAAQALQDSLKSKDEEIATLSKKIEELEQKLADAARAPAPEKQAAAPKEVKPVAAKTEKPAAKKTPTSAPQQAKAPEAAPAKVVSWELKAAQPGKAVLASRSTGDTRNVAVGDTVDGLGKITAISNDTGRWTVRGTKGQVIR